MMQPRILSVPWQVSQMFVMCMLRVNVSKPWRWSDAGCETIYLNDQGGGYNTQSTLPLNLPLLATCAVHTIIIHMKFGKLVVCYCDELNKGGSGEHIKPTIACIQTHLWLSQIVYDTITLQFVWYLTYSRGFMQYC